MKKTTTIAALSAAAVMTAMPLIVSADDDYREHDRHEYRHESQHGRADLKQYSLDEMRIMAYGRALRRFGPGVKVTVEETADGTYQVQLRDAEQNLIREHEFNLYGQPIRGGHRS